MVKPTMEKAKMRYKIEGIQTTLKKDGNSVGIRATIPKWIRKVNDAEIGDIVSVNITLLRRGKDGQTKTK